MNSHNFWIGAAMFGIFFGPAIIGLICCILLNLRFKYLDKDKLYRLCWPKNLYKEFQLNVKKQKHINYFLSNGDQINGTIIHYIYNDNKYGLKSMNLLIQEDTGLFLYFLPNDYSDFCGKNNYFYRFFVELTQDKMRFLYTRFPETTKYLLNHYYRCPNMICNITDDIVPINLPIKST